MSAKNPSFTKPQATSQQNLHPPPNQILSNSSQKSIPSESTIKKSPPLPKKDNILNIFPNEQLKPKTSPTKKLPNAREPSPTRAVVPTREKGSGKK